MTPEQLLEHTAEAIYDHVCLVRARAETKNQRVPSARDIGCPYADLWEPAKRHYRSLAEWHIKNK